MKNNKLIPVLLIATIILGILVLTIKTPENDATKANLKLVKANDTSLVLDVDITNPDDHEYRALLYKNNTLVYDLEIEPDQQFTLKYLTAKTTYNVKIVQVISQGGYKQQFTLTQKTFKTVWTNPTLSFEVNDISSTTAKLEIKNFDKYKNCSVCLTYNGYLLSTEPIKNTIIFDYLLPDREYEVYIKGSNQEKIATRKFTTLSGQTKVDVELTKATSSTLEFKITKNVELEPGSKVVLFSWSGIDEVELNDTVVFDSLNKNTKYLLFVYDADMTQFLYYKTFSTNDQVAEPPVVEQEKGLFISEYFEGGYDSYLNPTGNNNDKAIELYNPLDEDIDLANYKINIYTFGDLTPKYVIELEGTIKSGSTFVITNKFAQADLLSKANQTANLFFSGKHTITLTNNDEVIDIIGEVGKGYSEGLTINGVDYALIDHRMTRTNVSKGNAVFTESEWTVHDDLTFDDLGKYTESTTLTVTPKMVIAYKTKSDYLYC